MINNNNDLVPIIVKSKIKEIAIILFHFSFHFTINNINFVFTTRLRLVNIQILIIDATR